jgi:putative peptide maturation system protein
MRQSLQNTVNETLDLLRELVSEGTRPKEASARLSTLQNRHPGITVDLIWEEEAYDQSLHYDALLRLPGEGTVSLSFCPDCALPWPMRGVHRWSEADLARVNNTVLNMDQAIACLDFIWDDDRIVDRLINVCLIQEELEQRPIALSDSELQLAFDGFRRARKLHKTEDTRLWMARHGITQEELESRLADEATIDKLRDRVADGRIEDYFEKHRAEFDSAFIGRIKFSDQERARQIGERISAGELSFYEAAQLIFVSVGPGSKQSSGEILSVVKRSELATQLGAAVYEANPGEILGPLPSQNGYELVYVLSFVSAQLDEATQSAIKNTLFDEWLSERRRAAKIEWFWGNASRTSRVGPSQALS